MIHDVTIPFSFDTTPIENQIANIGEQEVAKAIEATVREGIYSALPKKNGWYRDNTPKSDDEIDWAWFMKDRFEKWLDLHTQEIVDEAAVLMAMRGGRKKAWREVLDELRAERDAE